MHAKKVMPQLMVVMEKHLVMQLKQCFLVQPTKLGLPDPYQNEKYCDKINLLKNNLLVKKVK